MTLSHDATLHDIRHTLENPEKFVRTVLGTMREPFKKHGNAWVRIGITGRGITPYHKVVYLDDKGEEKLHGAFDGINMDEKYEVHEDTWSSRRLSYSEVEDVLASITGYVRRVRPKSGPAG